MQKPTLIALVFVATTTLGCQDFQKLIEMDPDAYPDEPYEYVDVSDTFRIGGDYIKVLDDYERKNPNPHLQTPVPLAPRNRSEFNHYPRDLIPRWKAGNETAHKTQYLVQHQWTCRGKEEEFGEWTNERPMFTYLTGKQSMNIRFIGAQPGRWRVKAIDESGEGPWSEWLYFRFTE